LWAKRLNAKDINKEMSPVYVGKCFSRKAVPSWWQIFADDEEVRKWVRQQSNDFYAVGFDSLIKCINVGGGYFEK
jgi:hypothetical protein